MSVEIADFITAPNSGGHYRKVLLVVHVTVSPEVARAARGIVDYWNRERTGSTQFVVDDTEIIQAVREDAYAWAAGTTANKWGIHVEHCGFIQTLRQWRDGYSTAELERSAPLFAALGAWHRIPLRRIGPDQVRRAVESGDPAQGGICGHVDITNAFPGETTHTDPGEFFPWGHFMDLVREADQEDDMADYAAQLDRIESGIKAANKRLGADAAIRTRLARIDRQLDDLEKAAADDATRGQVRRVRADVKALSDPDAG